MKTNKGTKADIGGANMSEQIFVYECETIGSLGIIVAESKEIATKKLISYFEDMPCNIWSWKEWQENTKDFLIFDDLIEIIH